MNPPRSELVISDGKFQLVPTAQDTAVALPIDTFFNSLAGVFGPDAIALVVSGAGADGSVGAVAVSDAGGTVLVQDPKSAKFESMPQSVIDTGVATAMGTPRSLAKNLTSILAGKYLDRMSGNLAPETTLERLFHLLRTKYGVDFGFYKSPTISRRIQRRFEQSEYNNLDDFINSLSEDEKELELLYADMLVWVTHFFRDTKAFESLSETAIAELVSLMSPERQIRIWSAGCSSGEEAFSLAIEFAEAAEQAKKKLNIKILATDMHPHSLEVGSLAVYSKEAVSKIPPDLLEKYFTLEGTHYAVRPSLRRMVVFSPHNVMKDPPFTRIDLLVCRNLLIYLDENAQNKVLSMFHFSLSKGSYLFLGPSETLGKLSDEFSSEDARWRIFRKKRNVRILNPGGFMSPPSAKVGYSSSAQFTANIDHGKQAVNAQLTSRRHLVATYDEILKRYAPSGFLIGNDGVLIHVFGDGSRYMNVKSGVFNTNILDLVHEDMKLALSIGMERVSAGAAKPFSRRVELNNEDGSQLSVNVSVEHISTPGFMEKHILVLIDELEVPTINQEQQPVRDVPSDTPDPVLVEDLNTRIVELRRDLEHTEETLQTTIEELETSNEELQATNEELMASNEELQSTNEELHSVNEELFTVSAEHQQKIEELTELNNDMDRLLRGMEVGTIFFDENKCIRRFTETATLLFNLLPQDIGRPVSHITYRFTNVNLEQSLDENLETRKTIEHEIQLDDRYYLLRVLPFDGPDGQNGGSLVTVFDITLQSEVKDELDRSLRNFHRLYRGTPAMMHSIDGQGKLLEVSDYWLKKMGYEREEVTGRPSVDFLTEESREYAKDVLAQFWRDGFIENVPYTFVRKDKSLIEVEMSAIQLEEQQGVPSRSLAVITDVSKRNQSRQELLEQNEQLEQANEQLGRYALVASHDLKEPLRKIQNYADILKEEFGQGLSEDASYAMNVIIDASSRLSSLVSALLAYARSTRVEIEALDVDLSITLKEVLSDLDLELKEVDAKLSVGKMPTVSGDPHLLHQVIQNAISNCIKYRKRDEQLKISVKFRKNKTKKVAHLDITDNGIGFDQKNAQKAFEPFVRLHDRDVHFGSGIGLAIAKTIVDRHGWEVSASSEPDKGTTIRVSIPMSAIVD